MKQESLAFKDYHMQDRDGKVRALLKAPPLVQHTLRASRVKWRSRFS